MKPSGRRLQPPEGSNMIEYKTVCTRTLGGLKKAEALKRDGWLIGSVGLFTIQFYRTAKKHN